MPVQFQTWEFLFGSNIALTLLFPWLAKYSEQSRRRLTISIALFVLPILAALVEAAFGVRADLNFHLKLTLLHWGVSLGALAILWNFLPSPHRVRNFYAILSISALLSFLKFLVSSSLVFVDPFWGVVPGTISIDAIISLDPYYFRLLAILVVSLTSLTYRSAAWWLSGYWIVFLMFGFAVPSPSTMPHTLKNAFQESAEIGTIEIRLESKKTSSFSAEAWAREFHFLWTELKTRLPASAQLTKNPKFTIYIYESDDSKARWIGARQTEIGNFIAGAMHLSNTSLKSEVLMHELAHLVHGQLKAPLRSYIDPFYLEGLAVALSQDEVESSFDNAAAFIQVLDIKTWPKYLNFFTAYNPRVSYALAGGYANYQLNHGLWPWESPSPDLEFFKTRKLSEEKLEWAKKILQKKTLFKDPHSRDCARLEWEYSKSSESSRESLTQKLDTICPNWKTSPAYSPPRPELEILKDSISSATKDEDLKKAELDFYFGILTNSSQAIAANLLKTWKFQDSAEARLFKRRLEWELDSTK